MSDADARGVLVVVPALNEAATIDSVVAALLSGMPTDRPARLIVADGGSSDGTQACVAAIAARDPRVALVHNPSRIQAAAVNLAASLAPPDTRWLVRADAHAAYPQRFVADVVATLERTGADAVVVPMDSRGRTRTGRAIAWVSDTRIGSGGSAHRGGRRAGWIDHGHHAGWRLASYRAAGGYDEGFTHNEDAEFDCRLRAMGGRIWIEPSLRLTYFVRADFAALWRQYHAYGRGRSRTMRRHPRSWRLRQALVPAGVGAVVGSSVAAPFDPALWLVPGAYAAVLAIASCALAWRHRSGAGLLGGPAAMVMHFAWASGFVAGLLVHREPRWQPARAG